MMRILAVFTLLALALAEAFDFKLMVSTGYDGAGTYLDEVEVVDIGSDVDVQQPCFAPPVINYRSNRRNAYVTS